MQTIGLLLPRSTFYTGLSFDLFEGMRSSLEHFKNEEIRLVTENIGFGTDKQQCYKAAENILMHENAQVVFAYIGHRMAQVLRPLFMSANRLLIVLDAGANIPQEWPESSNIIYHSLHNAFGSWMTAKRAVDDGYTVGGMVTGYYDGGYLQTFGITSGYENAGGRIAFNHATGYTREDFTMTSLKQYMDQFPEAALLSIFSGDYVQWYFESLKTVFGDQIPPVYLPPFAFEEAMLKDAIFPGNAVKGIAAWSSQLDNESNTTFIHTLESIGRTPNLFSLLGWEAGIIAGHLSNLLNEYSNNIQRVSETIDLFSFDSPRGNISFHPGTKTSIAPLYNAAIENDGAGKCRLQIGTAINNLETAYETFISQPTENAISGWYNSYTCI